jgi:hypothetical protein
MLTEQPIARPGQQIISFFDEFLARLPESTKRSVYVCRLRLHGSNHISALYEVMVFGPNHLLQLTLLRVRVNVKAADQLPKLRDGPRFKKVINLHDINIM